MADGVPRPGGGGGADDPATESAIRRHEERLARDPTSLAFAPLADAYRKAGRIREAIALCQDGLGRYPHYFTARLILAKALMAAGSEDQALAELTVLVEQSPDDVQCHRLLADLHRRRGNPDRAISTWSASRSWTGLTGRPERRSTFSGAASLPGRASGGCWKTRPS